jgi:general secretion pathway protein D
VRSYFSAVGINLATNNGTFVFFNDRAGTILVRASAQDLETIAQAIEELNQTPPELTIDTKFASVTQTDTKGIGFSWFLGNSTLNNGAIGVQAGTAPSYQGPSTLANPSGIFPGPGPLGSAGQIAPSASDNVLTGGLENTVGPSAQSITPVATITGILTDPQFRMVINAIQQRNGADLLSAPRVTTESTRQAHVAVQDIVDIVTSVELGETGAGGVGSTSTGGLTGGAAVAASSSYSTTPFVEGPALDVLPTISADGFSIQMVLIPTYTEFVGYDNPGAFVPSATSVSSSSIGVPITAILPLPHYRVRQVVTSVNVWDGQTVVLGGLISETITKQKDEVPVLGDLPLIGRFFRDESSQSAKQNLMVFVTPTIIDPAGNRVHTDEDLPFAMTNIPVQPAQLAPLPTQNMPQPAPNTPQPAPNH